MQFFEQILVSYGWEGLALAGSLLVMFGVQVVLLYFRLRTDSRLQEQPPGGDAGPRTAVSVIVRCFRRTTRLSRRLPLILAQAYPDFEVVIVYVGHDSGFLRGSHAAQTVVSADHDHENPPRPPFSDFAQDGAQREHQVGALRTHDLHLDRCRTRRPTAGCR